METLFENRYVRDKATVREVYLYYYFKQRSRVILYIITALLVCELTVVCLFTHHFPNSYFLLLLWVALFFLIQFIAYYRSVSLVEKRDREITKGESLTIRFTVSDTEISVNTQAGAEYSVELSAIKHGVQTKNTIVLFSRARMLYIFRRDAFTVGDADQFLAFLTQKGLKIRKSK